jgi:hypothetical protein
MAVSWSKRISENSVSSVTGHGTSDKRKITSSQILISDPGTVVRDSTDFFIEENARGKLWKYHLAFHYMRTL